MKKNIEEKEKVDMIQKIDLHEECLEKSTLHKLTVISEDGKEISAEYADIIEKIHAGDESVFEDLDTEFGFMARRLMGDILKNDEDVKECWNDVMHSTWKKIGATNAEDVPKNLKAYIMKSARNKAIDYFRKKCRRIQAEPLDDISNVPDYKKVEEEILGREMERAIASYVHELSPDEKQLFGYVYVRCMKTEDIAKQLGENYGTVGAKISRLKKKMLKHLIKEGFLDEIKRN